MLRDVSGEAPTVVVHTDARAHDKLDSFRRSPARWIVAVNMVSEGVDIPRLRVGVYATAAKTALVFRQIVGRFVRVIPGRPLEPSWLYLPADPGAAQPRSGCRARAAARPAAAGGRGLEDPTSRAERRETERAETPDFVPLAADVAPQMSLFGGAPAAHVVAARQRRCRSAVPEHEAAPPQVSTFERRKLLRDNRRRLVADLGRRDGRPHAEINAWLNRETGVAQRRRRDDRAARALGRPAVRRAALGAVGAARRSTLTLEAVSFRDVHFRHVGVEIQLCHNPNLCGS